MPDKRKTTLRGLDEEVALRTILEGTATKTGEQFFTALVENLATALGTYAAWVSKYIVSSKQLHPFAFWMGGDWVACEKYDIFDTPCQQVIDNSGLIHIPENIVGCCPNDHGLVTIGAVSYLGVPLLDIDGSILGHMAVLDTKPMPEKPRSLALFQIFAARASAELQRLRAEEDIKKRERSLSRLFESAMDAIIEFDKNLEITMMNRAGKKIFEINTGSFEGKNFSQFISNKDAKKLKKIMDKLDGQPGSPQHLWIPGGFNAMDTIGKRFQAEATLSRLIESSVPEYTLILRDVNERIEAEKKIRSLTVETEYLKEEIKASYNFDNMIGRSQPMIRVFQNIKEVAATDATVLILGETGTGKELVARAVHAESKRNKHPFVKVNCSVIPANLIESEFFGHEQGAFTGATKKRLGRFALAHQGTIFLDEIGDLPMALQVKLLRVLQEGEFEPLGSSYTQKVDVRVIAATHHNLFQDTKEGCFREDLYYRLNIFPIEVPPLRHRSSDIDLLVRYFLEKFAKKMRREALWFSKETLQRLRCYDWPGNVRELENIVERAVITSPGEEMNLDRALPMGKPMMTEESLPYVEPRPRVRTIQELQEMEKKNLILALKKTGGKVSGQHGAAQLLGINQSTLSSRMKALKIKHP